MRIVAGTHRGRRIEAPPDDRIRPTSDRIRESLFNILNHRLNGFEGLTVLDGFAGTGALGLEALSRGAAQAIFIDNDGAALALCRRNAAALGLDDRCRFEAADLTHPPRAAAPADLVFLDPPYGQALAGAALPALAEAGWLAHNTMVVVEAERSQPEAIPAGFLVLETRDYGRTRLSLVRCGGTI